MKYEVGDKVRVRSDLVVDKEYGGWYFAPEMNSKKEMLLTISGIDADDYYIMDDGSGYWTDEMLEDVEDEFKLPKKWCIKSTKDNIESLGKYWDNGCGLREIYSSKDEFQYRIGKYWCSYNLASGDLLFSVSPGSNYIIDSKPKGLLEITFDQFKKYVLKESESTPVKDDVKFEVGKWYKYSDEYINHKTYAKYSSNQSVGGRFYYDEIITENNGFKKGHNWSILTCNPVLLTDLSEIQQYLPENHPDKIKKRTKNVEDLKYPDAVHCSSKEERDLLSKHVSHEVNEWNKDYPYLLIEGGNKSSPYKESDYIGYVNYEFSDIIFPEEKVETKPKLSKEELLAEAKRRYPVGTKYKCANGISAPGAKECFEITHGDELRFFDDSKQKIDAVGMGFVYYVGSWAEIISKPTVEQHSKYVECIGLEEVDVMFWNHNFTVGEIYLVEEDDGTTTFKINGTWCDKSQFKPSTKEAFDKQGKSVVEKKEELVQTEMSQRQACDSCKYNDNCGTKGFSCKATGGQHYPKDNSFERYIVAADPFDSESSSDGIGIGKFPLDRGLGFYEQMAKLHMQAYYPMGPIRGLYKIPLEPKDCFESDEIYVPIIKTEVKQIKL